MMESSSLWFFLLVSFILLVIVDWRDSYLFGTSTLSVREGLVILALLGYLNGNLLIDLLEYRGQGKIRSSFVYSFLLVMVVDITAFKVLYLR